MQDPRNRMGPQAALVRHLADGVTGSLSVAAEPHAITLYLTFGEVVAAQAADDRELLLRRLVNESLISAQYASVVSEERITFGAVLEELFQSVSPDALDRVLHQRFEDNVARFLGGQGEVTFTSLEAVFVDNIQMGIDAMDLLVRSREAWNLAKVLELTEVLIPGASIPESDGQRMLLSHLGQGATGDELVRRLPMEPVAACALIVRMLQEDVLVYGSAYEEEDDEDFATEEVDREEMLQAATGRRAAPVVAPPPERMQATQALVGDDDAEGAGDLSSYDAWLNHGQDELDMDAFADYETDRGETQGGGGFSTETHNLDRVELSEQEHETIELEDADEADVDLRQATSLSFGAPVLDDEEAETKINVASSVLHAVVTEMDKEQGAGRGQAAVRLLMEASPSEFLDVFRKAEPTREGTLPVARLMSNLRNRPASEHRRLLNKALEDLCERALSQSMDELSDDAIDQILEHAAGYRKRMGL